MRRFKCSNCKALLTVPETRGQETTCPHCNLRQTVPENAVLIGSPSDDPAMNPNPFRGPDSPPLSDYTLLIWAGYVLIVVGTLGAIFGTLAMLSTSLLMALQVFAGSIVTLGLGQSFHALRELVLNSRHP